jgi:hypothetical protein
VRTCFYGNLVNFLTKNRRRPDVGPRKRELCLLADSEFPRRYNKACDTAGCANVERLTYVGESYFDFTADAVPGQVGSFKAVQIVAKSKMTFQQQPSAFESAEGAEVKCP